MSFFLLVLTLHISLTEKVGGVSVSEIEKKLAPFIGLVLVAAQVLHLHLAKYRAKPSGSVKILDSHTLSYTPRSKGIRLR